MLWLLHGDDLSTHQGVHQVAMSSVLYSKCVKVMERLVAVIIILPCNVSPINLYLYFAVMMGVSCAVVCTF